MKSELLWGVDLGGTKIEIAVLDKKSNNVLQRKRIPTEAVNGYQHILEQIITLVNITSNNLKMQPAKIGFATPGTLDNHNNILKNSNTVCLNNKPLKTDLEKLLKLPVILANDANCFALAETKMGIVPDVYPNAEVVFGIILGTGVGGGIVVNGKVINGRHGISGEWGHNYLDESGGPCYCGRIGCVEKIISGPALEKYYQNLSGKSRSLKEIYAIKEKNDHAARTIDRLSQMFGKSLAQVINIIDPDVIVVGGGVGNIETLYDFEKNQILKYLFNDRLGTIITKPKLGDSAGVFGAAMLINQ